MRNRNSDSNPFIHVGPIGSGLILGAFFLFLLAVLLAYAPKQFDLPRESYWSTLYFTLSPAFAASGVLTLTLEFANSYQRRRDLEITIDKIQNATTDSILNEFIGDEIILREVKTHILKQNFVRKSARLDIFCQWDTSMPLRPRLIKKMEYAYEVHNLTSQKLPYRFKLLETKEGEAIRRKATEISSVSYTIKNSKGKTLGSERYEGSLLAALLIDTEDSVSIDIMVDVPPECFAEFKSVSQSVLLLDSSDPIVSINSITDMEVDVTHPSDVKVTALSLSPDPEKFELTFNEPIRKRWYADGLLPGQGILISFKKIPDEKLPVAVNVKPVPILPEGEVDEESGDTTSEQIS